MNIDVKVDAEAVNKMVTDAILESAIGTTLREVVSKQVSELAKSYNNPIEAAVKKQIDQLVVQMVGEHFKPAIEAKVKESLTDELVSRIATAAWENLVSRLDRNR